MATEKIGEISTCGCNQSKKFCINANDVKVIHKKWNTRDNKIISKTKNNIMTYNSMENECILSRHHSNKNRQNNDKLATTPK